MSANYLEKTQILDLDDHSIQSLIADRNWNTMDEYNTIGAAYTFVKDEIQFGYNRSDDISASEVFDSSTTITAWPIKFANTRVSVTPINGGQSKITIRSG